MNNIATSPIDTTANDIFSKDTEAKLIRRAIFVTGLKQVIKETLVTELKTQESVR